MKIDSMDTFEKLVTFMRDAGVDQFRIGTVEVKFSPGHQPTKLEPTAEDRQRAIKELLKAEDEDRDAVEMWST